MQKILMISLMSVCMSMPVFAANADQAAASQELTSRVSKLPPPPAGAKLPVASVSAKTDGDGSVQSAAGVARQAAPKPRKPVLQFNPPKELKAAE